MDTCSRRSPAAGSRTGSPSALSVGGSGHSLLDTAGRALGHPTRPPLSHRKLAAALAGRRKTVKYQSTPRADTIRSFPPSCSASTNVWEAKVDVTPSV